MEKLEKSSNAAYKEDLEVLIDTTVSIIEENK
jgi:hypothetical protein